MKNQSSAALSFDSYHQTYIRPDGSQKLCLRRIFFGFKFKKTKSNIIHLYMTPENSSPVETLNLISFSEQLQKLSDIENPTPLSPEMMNISGIKAELLVGGIDVGVIENNPLFQESIKNPQFRNENQGKGPAVVAVLGLDGYQKYFAWAMEQSINQPTLSSGDESSKARGLMQFLGETIALASGQMTPEDYCRKTNLRVGKKYQKDPSISEKFNLPKDESGLKKLKETSSVPKGSAIEVYKTILSLKK
jgi:hypothetical protein